MIPTADGVQAGQCPKIDVPVGGCPYSHLCLLRDSYARESFSDLSFARHLPPPFHDYRHHRSLHYTS